MIERRREEGVATALGLCSKIKRRLEMAEQTIQLVLLRQKVNMLTVGKKVLYQLPSLEERQDLANESASDGEEVMSGGDVLLEILGSDLPSLNVHEE
jgi:hypothetical protein